jgi:hypothetical protein
MGDMNKQSLAGPVVVVVVVVVAGAVQALSNQPDRRPRSLAVELRMTK